MKKIETKVFEVRDEATNIPMLAVLCVCQEPGRERAILRRAGYLADPGPDACVLMTPLYGGKKAEYDEYAWGDRTFSAAHGYIIDHWDELNSGDLIDVRVVLGEADKPCATDLA